MSVSGDSFSTAGLKAGISVQHKTDLGDGRALSLKVKPYLGHQWELEGASNTTRFVGAGTATTVNGRNLTTFEAGVGGEVRYDFDPATSLKLGVDLSRDRYEDRYVGFVGVGVKF